MKVALLLCAMALISAGAAYADDDGNGAGAMHRQDRDTSHRNGTVMPRRDERQGGPLHHYAPKLRHHHWRRGDRLPREFWQAPEIDWHTYRLRAPPHGFHWVRVDDDFVLVAIGGGLILDVAVAD